MENLSKTLSILIPMYNEAGTIEKTLEELMRRKLPERYEIIICDDDSTDESIIKAKVVAEECESISIVTNKPNGNKIGAIISGLQHIKTPYVLLLDADSMILEVTKGYLDNLVKKMQDEDIAAIGFKIQSQATNLLESFQALEFNLTTDGLRRLLGTIVCLAGPATLWKVDKLEIVLKKHSGIFEGDDLESTILATLLGFNVTFEARQVIVTTKLKSSLGELFRQRMNIWDVGLIRAFVSTRGFLRQRGQNGAFFTGVFITEILAHPFRILSIIGFFTTFLLVLMDGLGATPNLKVVSEIDKIVLSVLKSTFWIYLFLWILYVISIIRILQHSPNSVLNGLRFVLYFTFYMVTPLIPQVSTSFGQIMGFTYLWWYSLCAVLILISIDTWGARMRSLMLGFLMPVYFGFLFLLPRTLGFSKYVLGRMRGKYTF